MIIVYKYFTLSFLGINAFQHSKILCTPPFGMNSVLKFVYPTLWLPMRTYANQYMSDYNGEMALFPML